MKHALDYARHVLDKAAEAEKRSVPLASVLRAPEEAARYAERAVLEIHNCRRHRTPHERRRALRSAAARYARGAEWRANIPHLAEAFAAALSALADADHGSSGNPAKILGASKTPERAFVNTATEQLLAEGWSCDDLFSRGRGKGNKLSLQRARIAERAEELARSETVTLDKRRLSAAIRDRARVPYSVLHPFAHWLSRHSRRRRKIRIRAKYT